VLADHRRGEAAASGRVHHPARRFDRDSKGLFHEHVLTGVKPDEPTERRDATPPSYDPCVPIASDVDCEGGSGNGPLYTGIVRVMGPDEYGLDCDGGGSAASSGHRTVDTVKRIYVHR
jgi:hypothetical protein